MANLNPRMRKKYKTALLDAFPLHSELADLYRNIFNDELSKNYSKDTSFGDIVDAILTQCSAQDKLDELIELAVDSNPTNELLQTIFTETKVNKANNKAINVSHTSSTETIGFVSFVNRKKELASIFLSPEETVRYWVIDAPAGFGKTELLAEVDRRYEEAGWLTLNLKFNHLNNNLPQNLSNPAVISMIFSPIIAQLSKKKSETTDTYQSLEDAGMEIALAILRATKKESEALGGVALIIDNFEKCPENEIHGFTQIISGIFTGLSNSSYFFKTKHFRVFIAGRYTRNKIKNVREQFMAADIPLAPFTFEVLLDTIQEFAISKGISGGLSQAIDIAAQLMHITGGHPGFTADILSDLANDEFTTGIRSLVGNVEQHQRKFINKFYLQLISEFPKYNDHQLIDILVRLSPFRKYDRWFFLTELKARNLLSSDLDEESIERGLLGTYLVDRHGGFLHDGMYRYLLEVWLRLEDPLLYAELCKAGIEIYEKQLNDGGNIRRVEKWAIEYIYLNIIYSYYIKNMRGTDIFRQAQTDLLWIAKVIGQMKDRLSISDFEGMKEDFLNDLREDGELRFLFNFCAAKDDHIEIRSFENLLSFAHSEFYRVI